MAIKIPSYLQPQKETVKKKNVSYGNYEWDYEGYKKEKESYEKPSPSLPIASPALIKSNKEYRDFRIAEDKKVSIPTYLKPQETNTKKIRAATKNDKIVQQGKVPMKDLKRPDNPFAPAVVNFANTASFGLLERNNKAIDQLKTKASISSTVGSMAGYILPGAAGSKLVKPLTNKLGGKLLSRVTEGAIVGGGIEGASGFIGKKGLEQTKKNVAYGVALGGVADTLFYGAEQLRNLSKYNNSLKNQALAKGLAEADKIKNPKGLTGSFNRPIANTLPTRNVIEPKLKTKPISNAKGALKPIAKELPQPKMQTPKINNANGKLKLQNNINNKAINNSYQDLPQSINNKTWFHGTGTASLKNTDLTPTNTNIDGLFGSGIYLTDNADIAKGYSATRGKKTGTPTIYQAGVKINKVLDLEKPMQQDAYEIFDNISSQMAKNFENPLIVENMRKLQSEGATGSQIYKQFSSDISDMSRDAGISKSELSEYILDINYMLKEKGYDAYTHVGGKNTGNKAHQVLIMLDPNGEFGGAKGQIEKFEPWTNANTINKTLIPKNQLQPKFNTENATVQTLNTPINSKIASSLDLSGGNGKSRFANVTLENSANTSEQLAKDLKELDLGYDKITNETSLKQANMRIDNDLEKAVKYVLDTKEGSAEHTTTAIQLINRFQKEGNYERAIDIASDISSKLTKNGQAIQAASIYDRLSPEGILLYAQKQVNKINDERWFKGLTKEQKINPELAKQLKELSSNMKNLTGDAKIEASQELQQTLQSLGKSSALRKIESAQTIGQLLNPKTLIRNTIGNEIFYRIERLNKYIATPIDIARSSLTGNARTVTFKTGGQGGYWDGFFKGTKAGWKGVNPGGLQTQYDLTAPAFSGKWNPMTYLEKTLGATLKGFDYAAYTRAVNQTVGEMGELAAINSKLIGSARKTYVQEFVKNANKNILDIADQYGKYVTFQDDNALSKGLSAVKKGLNLNKEFGAGSLIIKYPKTPGALVMRGLDYSPAGFLKSAYTVAKPFLQGGKIDTRKATMELSRAITGTLGFTGLGYFLADNNVITGRYDKDKDVRDLENQTGTGSYKVNLSALERWVKSGFDAKTLKLQDDDRMFGYDWMQPIAMAVSFGANINTNLKENEGALNSASSVIASSLEGAIGTIAEQPVLQGLARQFQGYDLGQNVVNTLKGIPSSFTPTVLNQVRQLQDNTGRSTYDPSPVKEAINKAQVKIPGLSQKLPKAYDTEGKEKENFQDGSNSLLNVMFMPGTITKSKATPIQKEVLRIYENSGLKTQFPTVAPKTIPKSSTNPIVNLTATEMSEYQRLMGTYTLQAYTNAMSTDRYKNYSSDNDKAKVLSNAMADAKEYAKIEILKKKGVYWGLK